MTSGQIIIAFVGWAFLFYLNNRTLKRSEISRLKDRLADKVDGIADWLNTELRKEDIDPTLVDSNLSAKTTQLELKIYQINHYVGCEIIPTECVSKLRSLDVEQKSSAVLIEAHDITADIIEEIESSYDHHFLKKNFLRRLVETRKYELIGGVIIFISSYYLFKIIEFFISSAP